MENNLPLLFFVFVFILNFIVKEDLKAFKPSMVFFGKLEN